MKKTSGDIINLHMYTINDNHMMCGSWDMKLYRQNFLSFWTVFCPFSPLTIRKIKILKNWKKALRYYPFTHVYHKWQSYDVWLLRYGVWWTEFVVALDHFLPFYPPKNLKNQNFEKNEKYAWRYHHFTQMYQKSWSYATLFLRYDVWQM